MAGRPMVGDQGIEKYKSEVQANRYAEAAKVSIFDFEFLQIELKPEA